MNEDAKTRLLDIYELLTSAYGRRNKWWSENRDEIITGAILTQNTNWQNVEKALANLREEKVLSLEKLAGADQMHLAGQIRPAGYHNQKARVLIDVAKAVLSYRGAYNLAEYRPFLLSLRGIGPETADSILLYAHNLPIFVIDAYTIRIFSRLGLCNPKVSYRELQGWFMDNLRPEADLYKEYHALLISHAKAACLKKPICNRCPLYAKCIYNTNYKSRHLPGA